MESKDSKWHVLIFVYNADTGLFSVLTDFAHKIISPETYACQLCRLTYGNFTVKKDWKSFIENIPIQKEFLHRDEFIKKYPNQVVQKLPAVYGLKNGSLIQILSADEINEFKELDALKSALKEKIG